MKHSKLFIALSLMAMQALCANAQKVTLSNTFGGDSDETGSTVDFFNIYRNGTDSTTSSTLISDRLQLDVNTMMFESRIRLEATTADEDGYTPDFRFRGYGKFNPLPFVSVAAGNTFFNTQALTAAKMPAFDQPLNAGKMLRSGMGMIITAPFVQDRFRLVLSGGLDSTVNLSNVQELGLNFAADFIARDMFSLGATFQNVTSTNFKCGVFAGLGCVDNLLLNLGFQYNNTDTDILPVETKYSVSASLGYKIRKYHVNLGADVVSAVTDQRIKSDGSTENSGNYPFAACLMADWKVDPESELKLKVSYSTTFTSSTASLITFTPSASRKLPMELGTISAGTRIKFDTREGYGLASISFPITWKLKLKLIDGPKPQKMNQNLPAAPMGDVPPMGAPEMNGSMPGPDAPVPPVPPEVQ